jgi:hypothetical protein
MLSEETIGRLENWKFASAEAFMKAQPTPATENEAVLVEALSVMLGNSGWFDGHLGTVVAYALDSFISSQPAASSTTLVPYTVLWVNQETSKVTLTRPEGPAIFASSSPCLFAIMRGDGRYLLVDIATDDELGIAGDIAELIEMILGFAPSDRPSYFPVTVEISTADKIRAHLQGGEDGG